MVFKLSYYLKDETICAIPLIFRLYFFLVEKKRDEEILFRDIGLYL